MSRALCVSPLLLTLPLLAVGEPPLLRCQGLWSAPNVPETEAEWKISNEKLSQTVMIESDCVNFRGAAAHE